VVSLNEEDAEKTGKKAMLDINAKIKELLQKEADPRGGACAEAAAVGVPAGTGSGDGQPRPRVPRTGEDKP